MLEFLQTGKALSVLAAIGMIGFVSKLITRSLYKRLLKETDNMAMTRNKNLQNLKQRLENTCRLGQNIVNTQAYLDKQIDGFSFLHISLDAWNGVSMEMVLLGLLTGATEAFLAYWYELDASYIVLYASAAVMSGLFLAFIESCFQIDQKQYLNQVFHFHSNYYSKFSVYYLLRNILHLVLLNRYRYHH